MRKIFFLFLTCVLAATMAVAQSATQSDQNAPQTTPPADHRDHMGGRGGMMGPGGGMAQQLNLTDQQKTQMQGLMQTQRQQAQAIRQDTSLTDQQKQDKLRQLRQSTHQQMMGLLTPEQQQKAQQLHQQHEGMGRGEGMGKGRGMGQGMEGKGPGGGMGPLSQLNLTPDQQSKIQPILQSAHQQAQAVRQDSSLTEQQKREKMRSIHESTKSQVNGILTPEQQQQLQQFEKNRPHGPKNGPPSGF